MNARKCVGKCKDKDGNCQVAGADGFAVQCVGPWVEDKYWVLERYLEATYGVRQKFSKNGNSIYLDLFSGPGRCVIKGESKEMDGGCLRVLNYPKAPSNDHYFIDICDVNTTSLKERMPDGKGACFPMGDSNALIHGIVDRLLKESYKYHFAYVDPFGPEGLKFSTIEALAALKRIDLLIHFPIGAIRRNIPNWHDHEYTILDGFLGTTEWREDLRELKQGRTLGRLLEIYKKQLMNVGFPEDGLIMRDRDNLFSNLPAVSIKNSIDVELYVLILASKHQIAQKIWSSIIKGDPKGQGRLV